MKRKPDQTQAIEDKKPLELKKYLPRLIAVIVLFAVSLGFVYYGITHLTSATEGVKEVDGELDPELNRYQNGIHMQYYVDGNSPKVVANNQKVVTAAFSQGLKDGFRVLDARTTYDGWVNLATLNQNLGKEVNVPTELYAILKQADEMTRRGTAYNLFAGPFYAEWEALRYQYNPSEFDPLNDPSELTRLDRLLTACSDLSNFSLEFLDDEACTVRFTVEQSVLNLLADLEMADAPILDLNVLADAFKLQYVADRLELKGFHNGYLYSDSGMTVALSGFDQNYDFTLTGLKEDVAVYAAAVPIQPNASAVNLRAFACEGEEGFYSVQAGGQTVYRHPWLPADGVYRNQLLSAFVWSESQSVPETCFAALSLFQCQTPAEIAARAAQNSGCQTALLLPGAPSTVYTNSDALLVNSEAGFQPADLASIS